MASAPIHLAIAKHYLKKKQNLNYEKVIAGTLYPDAATNKAQAHYSDSNRGQDNLSHIQSKVNLYEFLKEHQTFDDFTFGWFLHLVTDYLFFTECFETDYLKNTSYKDFCKDLYFSYDCLHDYLSEKYHITQKDYEAYPSEYYPGIPYEKCLLSKELIDNFITRVTSIDIDEYIKKILHAKKNIKP